MTSANPTATELPRIDPLLASYPGFEAVTRSRSITALTALATSETPTEATAALRDAEVLLGGELHSYQPLLDALSAQVEEIHRLRRLAGSDPLTGVANRRAFDEALCRQIALHRRTGTEFALLVLDLDGLKSMNDCHGHAAGDQAILALARAAQCEAREADLVARLGGDEFAVLLPATAREDALVLAARIRDLVKSVAVAGVPLGVSIGVAGSGARDAIVTKDGLMAAADADLYRDKQCRNRRAPHVAA